MRQKCTIPRLNENKEKRCRLTEADWLAGNSSINRVGHNKQCKQPCAGAPWQAGIVWDGVILLGSDTEYSPAGDPDCIDGLTAVASKQQKHLASTVLHWVICTTRAESVANHFEA